MMGATEDEAVKERVKQRRSCLVPKRMCRAGLMSAQVFRLGGWEGQRKWRRQCCGW